MQVISLSQRPLHDNTQQSQKTNVHVPVEFEPTISASERLQTYALDRAASGEDLYLMSLNCWYHDAYSRSYQNIDDRFSLHSQLVHHKERHLFQELLLWSQIVPYSKHSPYQVWKRKTVTYWIIRRPSSKVSILFHFSEKWIVSTFFWSHRYKISLKFVQWEQSCSIRKDVQSNIQIWWSQYSAFANFTNVDNDFLFIFALTVLIFNIKTLWTW